MGFEELPRYVKPFLARESFIRRSYEARSSGIFFFIEEFQWFFIVLSVLPSKILAISAHLFPILRWYRYRIHSSSSLHAIFLILGLRWLCHLSLHCFPILPGKCSAIYVHFYGPCIWTSWRTRRSSSSVQGPLTRLGLSTFYHLWRHCTSVLPWSDSAIFFQFLPPCFFTASPRVQSSSYVQWPFARPKLSVEAFWYLVGPRL